MQDGPSAAAALSLSFLVLSLPSLVLNPISLVSNPPFLVSKASGHVRTGSVHLQSHIGLTSDMTSATLSLLPTPATVLLALPAGCLHLPVSCVYSLALATLKCFPHMVANLYKLCQVVSTSRLHILYATFSSLESGSLSRLDRLCKVVTYLSPQHLISRGRTIKSSCIG